MSNLSVITSSPSRKFDSYFKSAFTVDNVIFGFDEGDLKVLLIKRNEEPYDGYWALPGYFVRPDENLEDAAQRVLREATGIENVWLEQVHTFGSVNRHAFGRVITVAYYSLIKINDFVTKPAGVAEKLSWYRIKDLPLLAFDHGEILQVALERLRRSIRTRPVGFELLPPEFTLTDLQHLYEAIWETDLEKRNFRKKILSMNLLIDLGRMQEGVAHRPARLYSFDEDKYRELTEEGFSFELKEGKRKG
ncbi:MAG: NUDIX domain-containing protein [Bacteroidota bacterium]